MKLAMRQDEKVSAAVMFDAIADFSNIELMLRRSGVAVTRVEQDHGHVIGWELEFDWRGQSRALRLDLVRFDRPEVMVLSGQSDSFDIFVQLTVVALSRVKSRLMFELEIKPRNIRSRLMLQTAKLGKARIDRNFKRQVSKFLGESLINQRA